LYEKLLGADKNLSQAQILFELGQRAFNYGANVDDQGRLLRGSQAARLAGATRTLPGSMGNILAQQAQQDRAVRATALQAAEKDVQGIRDQNVKLAESQSKLQREMVRAAGKGTGAGPLGSSLRGRILDYLIVNAPSFAEGQLSPEESRRYKQNYLEAIAPIYKTDPETGAETVIRPQIDDEIRKSYLIGMSRQGASPQEEASVGSIPPLYRSDESVVVGTPSPNLEAPQPFGTQEKEAPDTADKGKGFKTLWETASYFTGPGASLKRMITNVPSLGGEFPEVTRATAFTNRVATQIVNAVRTSPRFADRERQEIAAELGLDASFLKDPMKYMNTLVGLENFLQEELSNTEQVLKPSNLKNTSLEQRNQAKAMAQELKEALKSVGIPRLPSLKDAKNYPTGSWVLYNGELTQVTRPKQRAQNPVDVGL
jgi:hypothetical protein